MTGTFGLSGRFNSTTQMNATFTLNMSGTITIPAAPPIAVTCTPISTSVTATR